MQTATLTSHACAAIRKGHDDAWADIVRKAVSRPQWEPRFVAFLCGSMIDVAARWRPVLQAAQPSARLSVTTVFTHQSPYVTWPGNRCELADLLIAFIDRTASANVGVATLIQAKQSDTGKVKLSNRSEKTQFDLLSRRPVFDVDQKVAPTSVDLSGLRPDVALTYGLAPPATHPGPTPAWSSHRWTIGHNLAMAASTYSVTTHACIEDTLVDSLTSRGGWSFDLPPPGKSWTHFSGPQCRDEWSLLINFLIETTFAKPLSSLRSAIGGGTRGSDHTMYLQSRNLSGETVFLMTAAPGAPPSAAGPLNWIPLQDVPTRDWFPVSNSPLFELRPGGRGDGGGGRDDAAGSPPENGPISAIVFELHSR